MQKHGLKRILVSIFCILYPLLLALTILQTISVTAAIAKERVAVLDFANPAGLSNQEAGYISNIVRGAARQSLPSSRYIMMTRENIIALLPPGRAISDCVGECAVETGRNIGARYVVTGEVTRFGNELRVTINLHETKEGNLLRQIRVGAVNVLGLEAPLEEKTLELLEVLRPQVGIVPVGGETDLGSGAQAWSPTGAGFTVVKFVSDPPGATVEVDGVPRCETPCSQALTAGTVEVAFKLLRYMPWSSIVKVTSDIASVSATLTPNFGWLTVTSKPTGMEVELDGTSAGLTPVERLEVGYGLHEVWVRDPNRYDEGKRVMIERGEHETLHLCPIPINGGLQMEAKDKDGNALQGDVWVDDKKVGKAWMPLTVQAGPREIEFRGKCGTWRDSIIVPAEELLVVQAEIWGEGAAGKNSVGMEMVEIPAGTFQMGSPKDEDDRDDNERQYQVTITQGFKLSATEVTVAAFRVFCKATGYKTDAERLGGAQNWTGIKWELDPSLSWRQPGIRQSDTHPVTCVSWYDAIRFCNWLSEEEGHSPVYHISGNMVTWKHNARGYRLPTEAEWEYACRAGTTTRFSGRYSESELARVCWYRVNSGKKTHPVGHKLANAWGLFDMHGNVWEWCWDKYGDYPRGTIDDPRGSSSGSSRILRGGSWNYDDRDCRSATRDKNEPANCCSNDGFRFVLDS